MLVLGVRGGAAGGRLRGVETLTLAGSMVVGLGLIALARLLREPAVRGLPPGVLPDGADATFWRVCSVRDRA